MTVLLVALSVFAADPADTPRHTANAPQGVLLDFTATWCGPCQQMAPIVSKLERQGFPVRKVDIDQHKALAQQYNVSSIPCFVLVVNDREVTRIVGQTDPYDHCNMTVTSAGPAEAIAAFDDLLRSMQYSDPAVRPLLDLEGLHEWVPGRTVGYAQLERAVDAGGFYDADGAVTAAEDRP